MLVSSHLPLVIPGQSGLVDIDQNGTIIRRNTDESVHHRFQTAITTIQHACQSFNQAVDKVQQQQLAVWQNIHTQLANHEDPLKVLNDPALDYERIKRNMELMAQTPVNILAHAARTRLEIIERVLNLWQQAEDVLNAATKKQLENYITKVSAELDFRAKNLDLDHKEKMNQLQANAEELNQKVKKEAHQMELIERKIKIELEQTKATHQMEIEKQIQALEAEKLKCHTEIEKLKVSSAEATEKRKILADQRVKEKQIDADITKLKLQNSHASQMKDKDIIGGVINTLVSGPTKLLGL